MLVFITQCAIAFVRGPDGLTATSSLNMRNHSITGLPAPISPDSAAPKSFVLANAGAGSAKLSHVSPFHCSFKSSTVALVGGDVTLQILARDGSFSPVGLDDDAQNFVLVASASNGATSSAVSIPSADRSVFEATIPLPNTFDDPSVDEISVTGEFFEIPIGESLPGRSTPLTATIPLTWTVGHLELSCASGTCSLSRVESANGHPISVPDSEFTAQVVDLTGTVVASTLASGVVTWSACCSLFNVTVTHTPTGVSVQAQVDQRLDRIDLSCSFPSTPPNPITCDLIGYTGVTEVEILGAFRDGLTISASSGGSALTPDPISFSDALPTRSTVSVPTDCLGGAMVVTLSGGIASITGSPQNGHWGSHLEVTESTYPHFCSSNACMQGGTCASMSLPLATAASCSGFGWHHSPLDGNPQFIATELPFMAKVTSWDAQLHTNGPNNGCFLQGSIDSTNGLDGTWVSLTASMSLDPTADMVMRGEQATTSSGCYSRYRFSCASNQAFAVFRWFLYTES